MKKDQRVGLGMLAGLVLLALVVAGVLMAQEAATLKFTVVFEEADGLRDGDRVVLSGVDIGTVDGIELFTQPTRVHVHLRIDPEHVEKVRADATAMIDDASGSLVNVSGQKVVKIINTSAEPPYPPMENGAMVEGMDGLIELNTWKMKKTLSDSGIEWKRKLDQAKESLSTRVDELNELRTSPEVQESLGKLRRFLDEMRTKGREAANELSAKWPALRQEIEGVLTKLNELGREYIIDQIRRIMEEIDTTLKQWQQFLPGEETTPPAEPQQESPANA